MTKGITSAIATILTVNHLRISTLADGGRGGSINFMVTPPRTTPAVTGPEIYFACWIIVNWMEIMTIMIYSKKCTVKWNNLPTELLGALNELLLIFQLTNTNRVRHAFNIRRAHIHRYQ